MNHQKEDNESIAPRRPGGGLEEPEAGSVAVLEFESRLRRAIENTIPMGILVVDHRSRIIYVNPIFQKMTGFSVTELLGQEAPYPFWAEKHGTQRLQLDLLRRAPDDAMDADLEAVECLYCNIKGNTFWVEQSAGCVTDENGDILGFMFAVYDIQKRKLAEEEAHRSHMALQLVTQRMVHIQENERRRIGQELHDSVCAGLASVKFMIERHLRNLGSDRPDDTAPFKDAVTRLMAVIEETQNISRNLHPAIIHDLGLLPAIRGYCRDFGEIRGLRPELDLDLKEDRLPVSLKLLIYRIVQEALNNIAKHSDADAVRIALYADAGRLSLRIRDNGRGFDVDAALTREELSDQGLGLRGMIERVEISRGRLEIISAPGQGTEIRAEWNDFETVTANT